MVGGRCLNQYMVDGRWSVAHGRWSVVGGWSVGSGFVLRPQIIQLNSHHKILLLRVNSKLDKNVQFLHHTHYNPHSV